MPLQSTLLDVRVSSPPNLYSSGNFADFEAPRWHEYKAAGLISSEEADIMSTLANVDSGLSARDAHVVFCILDRHISLEITRFMIRLLVNISDTSNDQSFWNAIVDNPKLLLILGKVAERAESISLQLGSILIMAKILKRSSSNDAQSFFASLAKVISVYDAEYCTKSLGILASCLEMNWLRSDFVENRGAILTSLLSALDKLSNLPQLHYYGLICLWLATFDPILANSLCQNYSFISLTISICKSTGKEKVLRVGAALWKNLLLHAKATAMPILIGSKVYDFCANALKKGSTDDDLTQDLQFVYDELHISITKLSSFDEYASEVKSGLLEWSPPHKSVLFWRENAQKLCQDNCEVLQYCHVYI